MSMNLEFMEQINPQNPILIVAGEPSGDLLGGELMKNMKELIDPSLSFFGLGGKTMSLHNFNSLEKMENLTVMGIVEALVKYRFLKAIFDQILLKVDKNNCQFAILIDYPGFNLRLAKELKKREIKVIFYVSPQIWAWKFKRIYSIKKNVDFMLVFFDFEKEIYDEYKVPCQQLAHPVCKRIPQLLEESLFTKKEDRNKTYITLMPGSRTSEISKLLKPTLHTAVLIYKYCIKKNRKVEFFLPNLNKKCDKKIRQLLSKYEKKYPSLKIHYFFNQSIECMNNSQIVILASGTATLEAVVLEKPMIIIYKVHFLTYAIFSFLTKVPFFGLVNLIAKKEICKEFIQTECKAKNIFQEAKKLIFNQNYYLTMKENVRNVKNKLSNEKINVDLASILQKKFFS